MGAAARPASDAPWRNRRPRSEGVGGRAIPVEGLLDVRQAVSDLVAFYREVVDSTAHVIAREAKADVQLTPRKRCSAG
jgi:hypothetical protein